MLRTSLLVIAVLAASLLAGSSGVADALGAPSDAAAKIATKKAKKKAKRKEAAPSPAFAVCLDVQPRSGAGRVLESLEARGLPAAAPFRFTVRPPASAAFPEPCLGSFGRKLDAWQAGLALRREPALAAEGIHIVGHRVISLRTASPAGPDLAALPGSSGAGTRIFPDLGIAKSVSLEVSDKMVDSVAAMGSAEAGSAASVGVVVSGYATVFDTTDAWLPPESLSVARLERFDRVVVAGSSFRCDAKSGTCLYWHRILYGETWREGVIPAGHVVPASRGTVSRDGNEVAYLTPRARLPYNPGPFFREGALDEPTATDVYDVWMYDVRDERMGRVDTVHVSAGTRISGLEWSSGDDQILVTGTGSKPVISLEPTLNPPKRYTYEKMRSRKSKPKPKPKPKPAAPKPPRA